MMQLPGNFRDNVLLETEQTVDVVEEKVTGWPEVAEAVRPTLVKAYCVPVMGVKLMVCGAGYTPKLCAVVAAAKTLSPACEA